MNSNDRWMRLYSVLLGAIICSPLVMIGTRIMQVAQEVELGFPASTGIYRHALGRRLDDMSWWVHASAAIACLVVFLTLHRIRVQFPDEWTKLHIAPNWLWTGWSSLLTIFYITRIYFQDTGNAFFYEYALETKRSPSLMNDPIMRSLQSWEGWHNILMTWMAAIFFPAAWSLLTLARRKADCDPVGRVAAVACLNTGIAPITMLWLFQVYRAIYISGWLGDDARLFKSLGWAMGAAAMSLQILPLIVLSFVGLFVCGLPRRYCLGFGNVVELAIDFAEARTATMRNRVIRSLSPAFAFLKFVDRFALGLWWTRKPNCPCDHQHDAR